MFKEYAGACIEHDVFALKKLYNDDRVEIEVPKTVARRLDSYKTHLETAKTLHESFLDMASKILEKCEDYVESEKRYSHLLEEEQEQELEIEQEEVREQYRPRPATPCASKLDEDVKRLVVHNEFKQDSLSFHRFTDALKYSSLMPILQREGWSPQLFVTRDFTETVCREN